MRAEARPPAGYANGTTDPGTSFEAPGSGEDRMFLDGGQRSLVAAGTKSFAVRNGVVEARELTWVSSRVTASSVAVAMKDSGWPRRTAMVTEFLTSGRTKGSTTTVMALSTFRCLQA